MKKFAVALMSVACIACAAVAVSTVQTSVNADASSTLFTETKCQISENGNKMLIVTGITETDLIYELGYEIAGYTPVAGDKTETNVYYESLTLGDETREAGVFIDGAEGLLIWEIAYDKTVSYSVKPYAYVGVMNVEQLIAPDGNTKTYGTEKANFNAFSVVFKNEDGSTVATETKNYGQTVSAPQETPEKAGYTFDAWYNGATAYDFTKPVTGALELTAKFNANTDTAYTVKVYKEKLLGGGYDLVETVNAKGTTDDTVSIEDVTVTADTTGMSVNATKSVQEGVVNANGSLELSVYYDYPKYGVNKKAWNLNYDANKNYIYVSTKNQDSTALEFASNAQKVYFAGKMNMNSGFGNYGFTVTSGTTQRWVMMSNDTIGKFMVRGCNYTGSGFSASDAGFTDVNHNGISSANVMTGYSKAITSNTNKSWNYAVVIKNDVMHIFLDDIFCFFIDLTTIGFAANSSYNVGIGKTWTSANSDFTIDNITIRTGTAVDKIFANFEKIQYNTFTTTSWKTAGAARYMLDGSVIMQQQESALSDGTEHYNGNDYQVWFKNASNVVYYKSTLKANDVLFSSARGVGFMLKVGETNLVFSFGGSNENQAGSGIRLWAPQEVRYTTDYVVNGNKILAMTSATGDGQDRSFTVEYIVADGVLYMFVDGTLTVKIVLSELDATFTASANYQIGVFVRYPRKSNVVGYYAPTLVYGSEATAAIAKTGYTLN